MNCVNFNFDTYKNETSILIDVLFKLREALTGTQINKKELNWKPLSCDILFKFTMNAITLSNILNGSKFITEILKKPSKLIFYDISSIFVLLRELLENYLTFNYLFIHAKSSKDIDMRVNLFKYKGLQRRQNYEIIPENHQTIITEKKGNGEKRNRTKNIG